MSELSELLERLRKSLCLRQESEDFCRVAREDVEIAMDAIEALPVWVKCSERMPAQWGEYLITFSQGLVMECDYNGDEGGFIEAWQGRFHRIPDVTHWMPMPKPAPPIVEGEK